MAGRIIAQSVAELLATAQQAIQSGELDRAAAVYRDILSVEPHHGLANYWLGVIELKSAASQRAVERLEIAAAKLGTIPEVHIDLGLAYAALDDNARSSASFEKARALAPEYASAQLRLAVTLEKRKQYPEAIEACVRGRVLFPHHLPLLRKFSSLCVQHKRWPSALKAWRDLLAARPEHAGAHLGFGESCFDAGEYDLALITFRRVVDLSPQSVAAHVNLGLTCQRLGLLGEAVDWLRKALALAPDDSRIHQGLGDVLRELGRWPEATAAWAQAVDLRPNNAAAWQNLGLGLEHQDRLEEALACHQRVAQIRPNDATAHRYLGMLHQDMGNMAAAETCIREALALAPNDPEVHWQIFELMAFRGEFPAAWEEYEWRWGLKRNTTPRRNFPQRVWTGEAAPQATILLHAEQGFGDTFQVVRFIPKVRERVGKVLLWVQPNLVSLLSSVEGVSQIVANLSSDVRFDYHLPLMSLPRIFGATLETIPRAVPYVHPPRATHVPLPESKPGAIKVGFVWCGSGSQSNDRRPVALEFFQPLLGQTGVQFYSLQLGPAASEVALPPYADQIVDLSKSLVDFAASASVIAQLDLVITVDTATAHLAGAMGTPVWILLSFRPDWRWLLEREDSPWYPTARLFRQRGPGTWPEVIERVGRALEQFAKAQSTNARAASGSSLLPNSTGAPSKISTVVSVEALLAAGLAHHRAGQWAQAEMSYRQALARDDTLADAWRLLGVVLRQQGLLDQARDCSDRALALNPSLAEAHHDRGLVSFLLGHGEEAVGSYRRALALKPTLGETYYHLGNALYALKQLGKAIDAYEKSLQHSPGLAEAHYNLGLICQQQNQAATAVAHYQRALSCAPDRKEFLLNLSVAQRDCGQIEDAAATLAALLKLDPSHLEGMTNHASVLILQGELDQARRICDVVLQEKATPAVPDKPVRRDKAVVGALLNLGMIHQATGQLDEAVTQFRRVLSIDPGHAEAQYYLGMAELLRGEFDPGWAHYEARWHTLSPTFARRGLSQPLWRGESLQGKSILVHAEQELGDTIQFSRFLPRLARAGATVVFECQPALRRLLSGLEGVAAVVARGEPLPHCDFHSPLLSLAGRLAPNLAAIPAEVPYLRSPPSVSIELPNLNGDSGSGRRPLSVGIVWANGAGSENERDRTIPFIELAPLWNAAGVNWHSLQSGSALRAVAATQGFNLIPQLADLSLTAALLQKLDLIVSVDGAIAHLAGALGKPVWVLLPFAPDWRWMLDRQDSPWYPTMKLFRQPKRGDWNSVMKSVSAALSIEVGQRAIEAR